MDFVKDSSKIVFGLIVIALISPLVSANLNPYIFSIVMYTGINIILAVSLNLVNGITGQFSMGHAGFMSVGGYTSAALSLLVFSGEGFQSLPPVVAFMICLLAGGVAASVLGYVVGLPSLRLKGDYLAIVTLGFGEIIRVVILNLDFIGGARGLPGIPLWTNLVWVYGICFISVIFVSRLLNSSHGRALLAIREDEIAAEAMGVNTTKHNVRAFVMGAFFAGLAGGLFAHYLTYLNPQTFDFNKSFEVITMIVIGGLGSTSGAIFAAILLTATKELLRPLQEITQVDLRMVIYSLMLILVMLTRPNGIFGTKELFDIKPFNKLKRFFKRSNNPMKDSV